MNEYYYGSISPGCMDAICLLYRYSIEKERF